MRSMGNNRTIEVGTSRMRSRNANRSFFTAMFPPFILHILQSVRFGKHRKGAVGSGLQCYSEWILRLHNDAFPAEYMMYPRMVYIW
jgi:hypothetical protein